MKYSISALSDNLHSKKFSGFSEFLAQRMLLENPNLERYFKETEDVTRESIEKFLAFSDLIAIQRFLKNRKDFIIDSEIVKDFQKGKHIRQDYGFTLKIPFPMTYVNFDDPIDVDMVIPKNYFEPSSMEIGYSEWLENLSKEKLISVKNRLHGIFIINHPETFRKMKSDTLRMQENQKTMHSETFSYYKDMNPDKTFKVYFILDDLRLKEELDKETKDKKINEKTLETLKNGFEYTNILFDSEKLPKFISEYGLGIMDMSAKKQDMLSANFSKFLDITIQIINFINSNDYVEQAPMWKSKKSKEHYERKFGRSLPPEFYMLRVKYPKEFMIRNGESQPNSPYGYQFDVKGHWRCLRSPRYKQKRGAVIWIPNYKKGHGLYIAKRYVIDSDPNKLTQEHLKVEVENK